MKIRIACCDDEKQQLELYKTMFTNIEMRQDIKIICMSYAITMTRSL